MNIVDGFRECVAKCPDFAVTIYRSSARCVARWTDGGEDFAIVVEASSDGDLAMLVLQAHQTMVRKREHAPPV